MSFIKCPNCEVNHTEIKCPRCHPQQHLATNPPPVKEAGVGTQLSILFPWMTESSCACKDYIAIMNQWGAGECGTRRHTLIKWIYNSSREHRPELTKPETESAIIQAIKKHQTEVHLWPFVWTYWANGAKGDELKYSIRSLLHWYPEAEVTIVGDKPPWYNGNFIHSPRIPKRPHHSFVDCYTKLHLAAEQIPQFIWMMDDVYWVKDFSIAEASTPKYVRHVSQQRFYNWNPKNTWAKTRAAAYQWLLDNNLPTYDFAGHLPQPIRSATFQQMEQRVNLLKEYKNWECIYFNMFHSKDAIDYGRAFTRISNRPEEFTPKYCLMNHTDSCFRGTIETYLSTKFPEECKYEN